MKRVLFLCLVLLIIALAGCGGGEATPKPTAAPTAAGITAEEIVEAAISASAGIETVHYGMDMDIDVQTRNGESVTASMSTNMTCVSDKEVKESIIEMSMIVELPEEEGGRMDIDSETYIVDGVVYMKVDMIDIGEVWVKQNMPQGYWEQIDQLASDMELLSSAQVELLGSEMVGGTDSYVLELVPDINMLWENMMQLSSPEELFGSGFSAVDLGEMVQNASTKMWVAKDTFLTVKSEIEMTMVMSSETFGGDLDVNDEVVMDIKGNVSYYNYNQPVTIELPAGAESAIVMYFLE